ncbi:glycosyltransferase [Nocardia arizonensis]|uniref:glycosyltransferase n=1 Tax=Nocardia arizonensis TaxID=1141647 RepID=UPI0006CFFCBE|nr:glycosyltransferase [Nocardia arizonensis]
MKIAMVSAHAGPLAEPGGSSASGRNVHVAALSAALVRAGHQVTVYTRRDDPHVRTEVVTREGYLVVHVPAGPAAPLTRDRVLPHLGEFGTFLQRHWAAHPADLVHAHYWMSALAAELAARAHRLPVIVSFHGLGTIARRHNGLADTSPRSRIRFERLIALRAAHVLAGCSDEAAELVRMGVPRFRTSVVPAGVDPDAFGASGGAPARGARHRLVGVGRLLRRKGFDVGVRALAELPDTELVIAGGAVGDDVDDDGEGRRLRRIAVEHGVQERLRVLGPVSHVGMARLYRSADVVLCTPWYEPLALVPLEAMSCRRPVVATAVGGLRDTVVDGVTGRLLDSSDPHEVARAVRQLLDDPILRETWGAAAEDRARSGYSWDRVAAATLHAYRRTVPEHGGAVASAR